MCINRIKKNNNPPQDASEESLAEQKRRQFAKRLKECRKAAGLTQAELAKKANMAPSVIARYETAGSLPRPETVERLAAALLVSPHDLELSAIAGYTFHAYSLRKYGINVLFVRPGWIRLSIPGFDEIEIPSGICNVLLASADASAQAAFKTAIETYRANVFAQEAYAWHKKNMEKK